MDKHLIIKIFKVRSKSTDLKSRVITLTYNTSKVHGGYRFDRLGIIRYLKKKVYVYLNLYRIAYWLNSGVNIKTKVSWFIGIVGKYEIKLK